MEAHRKRTVPVELGHYRTAIVEQSLADSDFVTRQRNQVVVATKANSFKGAQCHVRRQAIDRIGDGKLCRR